MKIEIRGIMKVSAEFMILWFASNYLYNSGLALTTVSSSTVLSNTSGIFVYIMGIFFLIGVTFNRVKLAIVVLSFGGVVLITLDDARQESKAGQEESTQGNVLSLLSACVYGFYAVILKKRVPEEQEATFKFSYFLGFVGLFNSVFLLPLFPLLNLLKIEEFEWPNESALKCLVLNAILGTVISDFCWAKSVVLLGPLLTTVGISMTIPISMLVDAQYSDKEFSSTYYIGSLFILGSFFALTYLDYHESKSTQQNDEEQK